MLRLPMALAAVTVLAMALLSGDERQAAADHAVGHVCVTEMTTVTAGGSIQERVCAESGPQPEDPAAVRVWLVDFKGAPAEAPGNYQVVRDRDGLDPQQINEYADECGATDAIEWKDCQPAWPDGAREKDWPVAHVAGNSVTLKQVRFKWAGGAPPATALAIGTVGWPANELVKFEKMATLQGGELVVDDVTSTGSLHSWVDFMDNGSKMKIDWTIVDGPNTYDAGASDHTMYVLRAAPLAGYEDKIYLTLVDYTAHQAVYRSSQASVLAEVWSEFTDQEVHRRDLTPQTGAIDHTGDLLKYYYQEPPGKTLDKLYPFPPNDPAPVCAVWTTEELLKTTEGRCGAWARFLQYSLAIHGIPADVVGLVCQPGTPYTDCLFLVKEWDFAGAGTSGDATYKWNWTEVTDLNGVGGQGVANPQPWFGDHAIVRPAVDGRLYDPSYGIGPYPTLVDYDDATMAGFCKLAAGPQFICQKNPVGAQLVIP